ncbi:UNVERIFIED_CONTAM: hypothetical protein FKN15_051919 [Acipenser sinensis]
MLVQEKHINSGILYPSWVPVRVVIDEMVLMKTRDEDDTANLIWNDSAVQHEKIAELRNYQRINHFPGMGEICRKDCLARNMAKMIKSQSQEYGFIPKTWIFPAEYTQFQNYVKELRKKRKQKTFIVKPANGAMGHGHKRAPLHRRPTVPTMSQLYMHLTNYSVNKHNENFERDETADKGSKRSISWFTQFLRTNDYDVSKFWGDVSELVVKTLIVAEPHVLHAYRMCRPGQPPGSDSVCFEILGFDIILDRKLKPWLLEINRAPSFGTDQKIDYDVKKGVLLNALRLLNIRASDKKRNIAQQKAEAQKRLYGRGSVKRLSPCSSEWEKQRHTLERRREELEEDILDLLEQCELDDEKLMGKSTRQRGPKPLSLMPESTQTPKKPRDDSSNTSCNSGSTSASEEEDEKEDLLETKEKKVSYNLEENKYKSLERSTEGEYLLVLSPPPWEDCLTLPPPPPWEGLLLPCLAPPKDACLAPPKDTCLAPPKDACLAPPKDACHASPGVACCSASPVEPPVAGYEGELELPLLPPWPGAPPALLRLGLPPALLRLGSSPAPLRLGSCRP